MTFAHRTCPECEGRGVLGPRFPEMWERAEDFICRHCDGAGFIESNPSEWSLTDVPDPAANPERHQRLTLGSVLVRSPG